MEKNIYIDGVSALFQEIAKHKTLDRDYKHDERKAMSIAASMHSHLDKVNAMLTEVVAVINATEQFMSVKEAQRELDSANDDLYELFEFQIIDKDDFASITNKIKELDELLYNSLDRDFL